MSNRINSTGFSSLTLAVFGTNTCHNNRPDTFELEREDIKCSELQDGILILTGQLTAANSLLVCRYKKKLKMLIHACK